MLVLPELFVFALLVFVLVLEFAFEFSFAGFGAEPLFESKYGLRNSRISLRKT